jgi:hypothetical protein
MGTAYLARFSAVFKTGSVFGLVRLRQPEHQLGRLLVGEALSGTVLILLGMAADRLLGLLALTMEEFDTACAHFDAAVSFCDRSRYRPEYARTASDYALAFCTRGQPGDQGRATKLHTEALTTARTLAMSALEERIIAEARS